MSPETENLTLDDLCRDVSRLLEKHGLLTPQRDGRVTDQPDPRTVRYYTTLGLIERPRIVDREARYGWRQVLQLLAVKALQHEGASLSYIQNRLFGRSDQELEQMLRAVTERPRPRPVRTVTWREVTVEPGLKLMVEDGWTAGDVEAALNKIRAALAALSDGPNGGSER